jgi:DUF4097 and DUF4098 domain-containing protein YvlB
MPALWPVTWALIVALISGGVAFAKINVPTREVFHRSYSLESNGRVVVENPYGNVRITAWDREEVSVEAVKTGPDGVRLNDARIVVDSSSGLIAIRTLYSGTSDSPANVEYRISIPRAASLENVKLTNGGLSLSGLEGRIKASAVNGDIKAERLAGETELSTVNGRLEVGFQRVGRLQPISLSSVNGPIRLSLPSSARASVEAHNVSGGIRADLGRVWRALDGHRLRTVLNRGGTQIQLRNINGGIAVLRAAS